MYNNIQLLPQFKVKIQIVYLKWVQQPIKGKQLECSPCMKALLYYTETTNRC